MSDDSDLENMSFEKADNLSALLEPFAPEATAKTDPIAHFPSKILHCVRQQVYVWNGIPEDSSFREGIPSALRMALGKGAEEAWATIFARAGILVGREIRTSSRDLMISGRMDYLIRDPTVEGHPIVPVELKTNKSKAWSGWNNYFCVHCDAKVRYGDKTCYVCKRPLTYHKDGSGTKRQVHKPGVGDAPSDDHYIQLQCYIYINKYPHGYIAEVDRDEGRYQMFRVFPDDNLIQNIVVPRTTEVTGYVEAGTLPKRPFRTPDESWQCRYCAYRLRCWEDDALPEWRPKEPEDSGAERSEGQTQDDTTTGENASERTKTPLKEEDPTRDDRVLRWRIHQIVEKGANQKGCPSNHKDLVALMEEVGQDAVDEEIEKMFDEGLLYEPILGYLKVTIESDITAEDDGDGLDWMDGE